MANKKKKLTKKTIKTTKIKKRDLFYTLLPGVLLSLFLLAGSLGLKNAYDFNFTYTAGSCYINNNNDTYAVISEHYKYVETIEYLTHDYEKSKAKSSSTDTFKANYRKEISCAIINNLMSARVLISFDKRITKLEEKSNVKK